MKKKLIISLTALSLTIQSVYAEKNCDGVVEGLKPQPASKKELRKAINTYELLGDLAKCAYPDVEITPLLIGEYESFDSNFSGITLSNRIHYKWGGYEAITTIVVAPSYGKIELSNGMEQNSLRIISFKEEK